MIKPHALLAALAVLLATPVAAAQVQFRRPVAATPTLSYHFDNNSAGGCRDYNCGSRCYDGHSGTDIPVPTGTNVLAGADGTVIATNNGCANTGYVGNPCGGRCGNYVQLSHADGSRTIYCHMQLNSIAVSRGQRVRCGQVIGRSASSGSSSGPHLHFGYRRTATAASTDPFRGRCGGSATRWTEQRAYPQIPGATCDCTPVAETCNNRDDDCDGRVDDGVSRGCYTGPAGTAGRGICRNGTQACSAGRFGACTGQVVPRAESCNRLDDDCDGMVDEGAVCADGGLADAGASDAAADDAAVPDDDAGTDDAGADDAASEEDGGERREEDAGFEDVGPMRDDDDVSPDRSDGCACRAAGHAPRGRANAALSLLVALAVAMAARRARRRG